MFRREFGLSPPVSVRSLSGPIAERAHAALTAAAEDGFGGAVVVRQSGYTILKAGYGYSNRDSSLPFTSRTIAQVDSLTSNSRRLPWRFSQRTAGSTSTIRYRPICPRPARRALGSRCTRS